MYITKLPTVRNPLSTTRRPLFSCGCTLADDNDDYETTTINMTKEKGTYFKGDSYNI